MGLAELQAHCRRVVDGGREPVVLFDLDGTLYDNTWRTLRILQEFAVRHAESYPNVYDAVLQLRAQSLEYRLTDALRRVGVCDEAILDSALAFWKQRFFTNAYQSFDLALPGAVEFANRARDAGAVVVYFTGRDAPNMLLGTISTLQRDGFPVGTADTHVVMKPDFDIDDTEYKTDALGHIRRLGEVVAAFDNEPTLANRFHEAFPEAAVYHVATTWAPTSEPVILHDAVRVISDFRPFLASPSPS